MRASVDEQECIGSGMCVGIAPEIFELTSEGHATVVAAAVGSDEEEAMRNAAACCPVEAITIEDDS